MLFYVQDDIQVACRPAKLTDFASACETDAGPVLHPRRNIGVNRALAQNAAFALALRAGIGNHAARTLARRTGASNAEESLLVANLAAPRARAAGHRALAWSCAGAVAFLASLVAADCNTSLFAEKGFFEFEREILAKVGAALHPAATAAATSAEQIAEAEELAEDVAEVLEDGGIESRTASGTA